MALGGVSEMAAFYLYGLFNDIDRTQTWIPSVTPLLGEVPNILHPSVNSVY